MLYQKGFLASIALFLLMKVKAQMPCDDEYGANCPEEAPGPGLASCLRENNPSEKCLNFLDLQVACEEDLDSARCTGTAFSADALLCLTSWTPEAELSESCKAALPKKEEKVEKQYSPEEQERRKKRKRARAKAAKEVKNLQKKQQEL